MPHSFLDLKGSKGKLELAYIAGIFDGEGCIGIARSKNGRYYHLIAELGMANKYISHLLKFHFGGSVHEIPKPDNCQVQWHWRVASVKADMFLRTIVPYLRLKKAEAQLGIEFQKGLHRKRKAVIPDEVLVVRQAQKILMSKLKKGGVNG